MKKKEIRKHEYLRKEDYYETRSVQKGRSQKICEHCEGTIGIGKPCDTHHFYPEFASHSTHLSCTEAFMKSLK